MGVLATLSGGTEEYPRLDNLAFLPVLPYPITQYDTVYTKRRSFDAICKKLVQIHIPMFADEKVYAMIREIKFLRPDEFEPIIPMLGAWHAE